MTTEEWLAEGKLRFGNDQKKWRFVCPVCGHMASVQEWIDAGAGVNSAGFSFIGRWLPKARDAMEGKGPGPCNYAGGGLFQLNPVDVDGTSMFDFSDPGKANP